ncbi:tRNA (5-methylaminomethyl-2-thiouridine)(34)-methyltransferase MnmD [Gramella sp. AN32]|uniref:tRNA (5-methylaminomethyl-2-thiouridine)(34)-methyltransferase MnmD n=1 Tax=Christiangramia antarctica TaxID=2058158 RepID=A0ABW5X8J8_9FLAO|nr:tRNA (5-methylaminomethyl-2-thiouridine)(34)-methyltransferase MnmD [Gramella sp. AN32]MCM4158062.1 SAM-dependent methyltransferase [Gramella sp. AN32]
MERKIIKTADGSVTIHLPEWNEQYHSKHGAIQEAQHVFIKSGLYYYLENFHKTEISVLEIGFGTGLNAFLTALEAAKLAIKINYTGVEAYPVKKDEIEKLNYPEAAKALNHKELFQNLHKTSWEKEVVISPNFELLKQNKTFDQIDDQDKFDLIYFDAFGARVQPELWTEEIFHKMFSALKQNGTLVTYAAKGSVRRAMIACGFKVEKIPGPPGKREMLRAVKYVPLSR